MAKSRDVISILQLLAGVILVMPLVSYNILRTFHLFLQCIEEYMVYDGSS